MSAPQSENDEIDARDAAAQIFVLMAEQGLAPAVIKQQHPELDKGWPTINQVCKLNATERASQTTEGHPATPPPASPRGSGTSSPRPIAESAATIV